MISTLVLPVLTFTVYITAQAYGHVASMPHLLPISTNNLITKDARDIFNGLHNIQARIGASDCGINICFVMDGSGSTSKADFETQKHFIELIAVITSIDKKVNFCGVQYSSVSTTISPFTDNRTSFLQKVRATKQKFGSSNMGASLQYVSSQMSSKTNDANYIIVFGDGNYNSSPNPERIAKSFLASGGSISGILIANVNKAGLEKITGSSNKIFYVDDFLKVVSDIDKFVQKTCK